MPACNVSVLICTCNRAEQLRATLQALARVEPPGVPWEVVAIDNNSMDHTADVVRSLAASFPVPLKYVFEPNQGRSWALNRGIAETASPVLAFTDDDVQPGAMWLRSLCRELLASADVDYVGGPVRPMWEAAPPAWFAATGRSLWGTLAILDYGDRPFVFEERKLVPLGVNFAVRRALIEAVGPFDTALGRGRGTLILGQEMPEFLARTRAAGARGRYLPDMVIEHHVPARRLTTEYWRRWWYGKGVSRARLEQVHPVTELGLDLRRVPTIAGVPRFLFGNAARDLIGWTWAALTGDVSRRIVHETQLCYFGGQLAERRRLSARTRARAHERHSTSSCDARAAAGADAPDQSAVRH